MSESNELRQACLELALTIKIVDQPITSHEAHGLADQYAEIATSFLSEGLNIDCPLLARAVRYLAHVHAIPPMGDNTQWFANMLQAVIEVARPNTSVDERGKEFLRDMRVGINSLLED